MIYKTLGKGLGVFSLLVGAAQLFGAKRIARTLDAEGHEGLIKGFGARELLAGASLMAAPAASTNMWGRVAGDAMDLGALGLAARRSPRNRAIWGAIAFGDRIPAYRLSMSVTLPGAGRLGSFWKGVLDGPLAF